MKKTIGLLVAGLAALALLLYTCGGPNSTKDVEATEPVAADVRPSSAPTGDSSIPSSPVGRPNQPTANPAVVRTPPSQAPAPTPDPAIDRTRTPSLPDLTPLGAVSLPVPRMDALLAIHPRDLEAGSGPAVLIPIDSLRPELRIPIPDRERLPTDFTRGQPASTINTPTAYGQRFGDVFAGAAYQERIRYDDWHDGIASVGFGLGSPTRYAGLDVAVNILDTYTDFGEDRSLSLKVHRRLPFRSAVAIGHENIWHTDGTDGGSSRYIVVSKIVLLRSQPTASLGSVVVNAGLGTDRFLPEDRFAQEDRGVNPFGSVAVRVLPPVNAIANWTGQDLALGLSIAPVRTWPIIITPAMVDVTGRAGDGARFSVSAGMTYRFDR